MFIDYGRIIGVLGNKPHLMKTMERHKIDSGRDVMEKVNSARLEKN